MWAAGRCEHDPGALHSGASCQGVQGATVETRVPYPYLRGGGVNTSSLNPLGAPRPTPATAAACPSRGCFGGRSRGFSAVVECVRLGIARVSKVIVSGTKNLPRMLWRGTVLRFVASLLERSRAKRRKYEEESVAVVMCCEHGPAGAAE